MRPSKRSDRLAEVLRQEISLLVLNHLKDPRLGFVTITRVKLSDDLKHAQVYFSVLGDASERKASQVVLDRASGHLRSMLKTKIISKTIPQISFKFDPGIAYSVELESVFQKLRKDTPSTKDSAE